MNIIREEISGVMNEYIHKAIENKVKEVSEDVTALLTKRLITDRCPNEFYTEEELDLPVMDLSSYNFYNMSKTIHIRDTYKEKTKILYMYDSIINGGYGDIFIIDINGKIYKYNITRESSVGYYLYKLTTIDNNLAINKYTIDIIQTLKSITIIGNPGKLDIRECAKSIIEIYKKYNPHQDEMSMLITTKHDIERKLRDNNKKISEIDIKMKLLKEKEDEIAESERMLKVKRDMLELREIKAHQQEQIYNRYSDVENIFTNLKFILAEMESVTSCTSENIRQCKMNTIKTLIAETSKSLYN